MCVGGEADDGGAGAGGMSDGEGRVDQITTSAYNSLVRGVGKRSYVYESHRKITAAGADG